MSRSTNALTGFAASLCAMLLLGLALPVTSYAAEPAGNSGTVKVDGLAFDSHHDNEPHPSCDFRLTFWGFGTGRGPATATFALQSPTNATTGAGRVSYGSIPIGSDAAGGGKDYDGQLVVNLSTFLTDSGATPHPKQGFHVKLTVNAPGAQGSDVKHKVFWVKCASATGATPAASVSPSPLPSGSSNASGSSSGTGSSNASGSSNGSDSRVGVLGSEVGNSHSPASHSAATSVLGLRLARERAAAAGVLGVGLATTGVSLQWMILLATVLALAGAAMMMSAGFAQRRKVMAENLRS
jgi:hypothetical protein